jgi:hypothetical protein
VIFIDANIPMYLIGAPHPNKDAARRALELVISRGERMVTSAEVMQEILHRYGRIQRPDAIQPALDALLGVVDEVFPIDAADVQRGEGRDDGDEQDLGAGCTARRRDEATRDHPGDELRRGVRLRGVGRAGCLSARSCIS